MILKEECKKINITVQYLSDESDLPVRTLQRWCKSHPKRIYSFLDAIRYRQLKGGDSHLQGGLL